jgi:hypothetical protein
LFALFLLVLQPVCAAYERHVGTQQSDSAQTVHDGTHDSTPCCSEVGADAIASFTSAAAGKNFPIAQMLAALPLAYVIRPRLILTSHPARGTSPPVALSYHARSARLLR